MERVAGFTYICPNCNYTSFVYSSFLLTKECHWHCCRCYALVPPSATIPSISIQDLIEEGFDMNIHGKESTWIKVPTENTPDEIELICECTISTFECPYCKAQHQQFIELQHEPYKVGILCLECNTIYYGQWKETLIKEEVLNGTNT